MLLNIGGKAVSQKDLILSLIKYRMTRAGIALGLPESEAVRRAESVVIEQGLTGFFGGVKLKATPDSALVSIIETWLKSVKNLFFISGESTISKELLEKLSYRAIENIENHRSKLIPGLPEYPRYNLHNYVIYRTQLEISHLHGIQADAMGLDSEALRRMTDQTLDFFKNQDRFWLGVEANNTSW